MSEKMYALTEERLIDLFGKIHSAGWDHVNLDSRFILATLPTVQSRAPVCGNCGSDIDQTVRCDYCGHRNYVQPHGMPDAESVAKWMRDHLGRSVTARQAEPFMMAVRALLAHGYREPVEGVRHG